jgi:hypothetical protein
MWLEKTAVGFEHLQGLAVTGIKTNYLTFQFAGGKSFWLLF